MIMKPSRNFIRNKTFFQILALIEIVSKNEQSSQLYKYYIFKKNIYYITYHFFVTLSAIYS